MVAEKLQTLIAVAALAPALQCRDMGERLREQARIRFDAGLDPQDAADDIDLSDFADWNDPERIAANVVAAYREFDPSLPAPTPAELFVRMAGWMARH